MNTTQLWLLAEYQRCDQIKLGSNRRSAERAAYRRAFGMLQTIGWPDAAIKVALNNVWIEWEVRCLERVA